MHLKNSFINKYSEFILNETLKTHDINLTIYDAENEFGRLEYNTNITQIFNKIELEIYEFDKIQNLSIILAHIDSFFIDRHGWFPSSMKMTKHDNRMNLVSYNEKLLLKSQKLFSTVKIIYEPKYDIVLNNPPKMYHLSIQQYSDRILKNGLVPKSKSKLSKHLDRIYLCDNYNDYFSLINKMKVEYSLIHNERVNVKWIIYEIDMVGLDIRLYKDPNYRDKGSYVVDNIPPDRISVFKKEN